MVRAFLVYLRPDWGFVAIGECQRVTHATLRITHTHKCTTHSHTYTHTLHTTHTHTQTHFLWQEMVAVSVERRQFPSLATMWVLRLPPRILIRCHMNVYVGFRDPNKEQRSWSTRSYYYYLRPCIKCTSSELSAFILRVHFQLQMEKSLRKLVHQSRLWWWMNRNEKA